MSVNRALAAVHGDQDLGKSVATRTGKVIHRVADIELTEITHGEPVGFVRVSCGKILNVITTKHVTLADKKGRWGLLLGGGRAAMPTCPECLAAHYEAIEAAREVSPEDIALANISAVPATKEGHEEISRVYGQRDPQTAQVGDIVYGYSRGYYRRGVVTKVTPTKVEMLYTTDGAIKDAQRIFEHLAGTNPNTTAAAMAEQAAKNYTYYRKTAAEYQRRVDGGETLRSFEQTDFANIKALLEEPREDYIARCAVEAFESAHEKLENNTSYRKYVHFTTKAVKKSEIYLV